MMQFRGQGRPLGETPTTVDDDVRRNGQRIVNLRNGKVGLVWPSTAGDWPIQIDALREQDLYDAGWIKINDNDVPLIRVSLALEELTGLLRRREDDSVTEATSRGVVDAVSDLIGNIRQRRNLAAGPTPEDSLAVRPASRDNTRG